MGHPIYYYNDISTDRMLNFSTKTQWVQSSSTFKIKFSKKIIFLFSCLYIKISGSNMQC
jgi:hypothetical protein